MGARVRWLGSGDDYIPPSASRGESASENGNKFSWIGCRLGRQPVTVRSAAASLLGMGTGLMVALEVRAAEGVEN